MIGSISRSACAGALLLLCLLSQRATPAAPRTFTSSSIATDDLDDWSGPPGGFEDVLATPHLDRWPASVSTFTKDQTNAPACNPYARPWYHAADRMLDPGQVLSPELTTTDLPGRSPRPSTVAHA